MNGFTTNASYVMPAITLQSLLATMAKFRALPQPLRVIFATPCGLALVRNHVAAHVQHSCAELIGLGMIKIVECPTAADCQTAAEAEIERGHRAAILTDYIFFDPFEAAREFAAREAAGIIG